MATSSSPIWTLPSSLLFLVHLHLLEYTYANSTEYDDKIWNPQARGLRDRTKTMEDVAFFLVGKIHGNAKTVFPMYPCSAPADTTHFRSALTKCLETLRHPPGEPWWWKDVVVRKSLLEECAGDRFERIMLSLATHALFKSIVRTIDASDASALLQKQALAYTSSLASAKLTRKGWETSAAALSQRGVDHKSLTERLKEGNTVSTSPHADLTTPRLAILAQVHLKDLLSDYWQQDALNFLSQATGLQTDSANIGEPTTLLLSSTTITQAELPPQPLPIAAAHHPSSIRRLHISVFAAEKKRNKAAAKALLQESTASIPYQSGESSVLRERLATESQTHKLLQNALARTKKVGEEMKEKLAEVEIAPEVTQTLQLWDNIPTPSFNFGNPTPAEVVALGLYTHPSEESREARIDEIRGTLLTQYPPLPRPQPRPTSPVPKPRSPSPPTPVPIPVAAMLRRKSVRASLALGAGRRHSNKFVTLPEDEEICKIVDSISDGENSNEDPEFMTPRAKPGSRTLLSTIRQDRPPPSSLRRTVLRPSFAMPHLATPLPSLEYDEFDGEEAQVQDQLEMSIMGMSEEIMGQDMLMDDQGLSWMDEEEEHSEGGLLNTGSATEDEEDEQYEGKSMTLRDILLRAGDGSQFDLLEDDGELDDTSFDWE